MKCLIVAIAIFYVVYAGHEEYTECYTKSEKYTECKPVWESGETKNNVGCCKVVKVCSEGMYSVNPNGTLSFNNPGHGGHGGHRGNGSEGHNWGNHARNCSDEKRAEIIAKIKECHDSIVNATDDEKICYAASCGGGKMMQIVLNGFKHHQQETTTVKQ